MNQNYVAYLGIIYQLIHMRVRLEKPIGPLVISTLNIAFIAFMKLVSPYIPYLLFLLIVAYIIDRA